MLDSHHPKCVAGQLAYPGHAKHTPEKLTPSRSAYAELATFASKKSKGALMPFAEDVADASRDRLGISRVCSACPEHAN